MLKSQAWRRRARKTSALGLMGTLVVFVCSIFTTATPASAADVTKSYTYTCGETGPFVFSSGQSLSVTLTAPTSVTAGQVFDIDVDLPAMTLEEPAATGADVKVALTMQVTGATITDPTVAKTLDVKPAGTQVQAGSVTYKATVNAAATTATPVRVTPGALALSLSSGTSLQTTCSVTSPQVLEVPIGTGSGNGNDDEAVVTYECDLLPTGTTNADYPADVDIRVVMTPPTTATANQDASITWAGTIESTGDSLTAPTGFPATGAKAFVNVKASGAGAAAPTTPVQGTLTNVTAGSEITTIPGVTVKVRPTTSGTVTLTAGDLYFGASTTGTATSPVIKCTAPTTGLKTYTFAVGNGTPSPTPSATTTSPRPTLTTTATVTVTPPSATATRSSRTPKAGADTGAGGMAGPDGRMFILTGTALIAAAAVGGLVMRRRAVRS